jgi:hypothetical protein
VRDLLQTKQTPAATTFPDDTPALGFDNNGDLQTLSPVQFRLYQQAAESLAAEAMAPGSPQRAAIVTCDLATGGAGASPANGTGASCAKSLIEAFGGRAFRRPLIDAEVTTFSDLMATAAQAGATPDEQFRTVIEAMLVSPNFLFRPEIDTDPISLTPHPVGAYEVASRLSYMVYRSMPDQGLFDVAGTGALSTTTGVQAQLERMLSDSKNVFAPVFASMWLGTSIVATQMFDSTQFPKFTPALANSMLQEVNAFFGEFLTKNEPVTGLLTSNFSYIDANLAGLYGVPAPAGNALTRVVLKTPQRGGGLLTMSGVLSVTSYPTRTSIVKRGAYVLSQLLCAPPPSPPPNVPPFPTGPATGSQEQVLAQHRTNPECAACHDLMDNIGSALEDYDAIGAWRTVDDGYPVDDHGKFVGPIAGSRAGASVTFAGGNGLAAAVAANPAFVSCVAQNALSYALGRTLRASDNPYLAQIVAPPSGGTLGLRDVLMNVVASDAFRLRRGDTTMTKGVPTPQQPSPLDGGMP